MKNTGFTLVELIICVALAIILCSVGVEMYRDISMFKQHDDGSQTEQYVSQSVYSAPSTTQCIEGYKTLDGRQMVDDQGRGIPCGR